jgi:hypothetical protein
VEALPAKQNYSRDYRIILENLWGSPRIHVNDLISILGTSTAGKILKKAHEQQIIIGPEIRKRSYNNLREYMYFITSKDPESEYLQYRKDPRVSYHALMIGFCDLWLISKEKIEIEGNVILEGYRSDYYMSYAHDHPWEKALEIMKRKIDAFNPESYQRKIYIQTHLDELIEWDEIDETLYRYFKHDLRKPFTSVMKEHEIPRRKIFQFLENLPETCTIATSYYPATLRAYDPYLFMFETDYEDFIVELFSELPTSVSFFKVSDKLFVLSHVLKPFIRSKDPQEAAEWYIPLNLIELSKKGIVRSRLRASIDYFWAKRDLTW